MPDACAVAKVSARRSSRSTFWRFVLPVHHAIIEASDAVAVQLQEPFDRVGQRCPLFHQAPALPEQSLAVFLLNARYPHPAEHRRVAPVVRKQRAHHLPGVDPIRLALLRLSVHQKARRIEHDRLDRHRSVQPARQPEPLVARFVTAQNTHFAAERAFGLGLLMLDQVLETYDVRCPKRVQADPLTRRALDPDDPTLPAYLDRDVQRVVPVARLLPRQRSRLAEPRSPRPFTETTAMCLTSYDYENLFWR